MVSCVERPALRRAVDQGPVKPADNNFCLIRNFMHPMLNTAIKAARRAGAIINRASLDLERLQVARKGPKDYVTEVDHAAEEAIIDVLRTAYPSHAFLGEETGEVAAADGSQADSPEFQ